MPIDTDDAELVRELVHAHAYGLITEQILLEGLRGWLTNSTHTISRMDGNVAFALGRLSTSVEVNLAKNQQEIMDRMDHGIPAIQVMTATLRRRYGSD